MHLICSIFFTKQSYCLIPCAVLVKPTNISTNCLAQLILQCTIHHDKMIWTVVTSIKSFTIPLTILQIKHCCQLTAIFCSVNAFIA
ncbi:hypothetical protein NP493_67g05021 [Ridgeia piscesae]|uniref:Uncharacterized protein n=1 Tax=Ridgeia piscesae TaxID=27915 RepID=A0AAD9UIR0_RIDPI|nr:hypothetical protein NP493_67g05021 [Ridgeia piscesae]